MKKEYIGNFGDVGDFAVVGAGYNAVKAKLYNIAGVRWTHFYIGCLINKDEVKSWGTVPEFKAVNVVSVTEMQMKSIMFHTNPDPVEPGASGKIKLQISPGLITQSGVPLLVAFQNPLVFDMRCFSFDRVGNTDFWSPRFPTVSKGHFDRDFTDTISFQELQNLAAQAKTQGDVEDSQENLAWIAKLEGADPRGVAVDAISQLTRTTEPTPSPRRMARGSASQTSSSCASSTPERSELRGAMPLQTLPPVSPNQLITPPTSSAPEAATTESYRNTGSSKRKLSADVTASPRTCQRSRLTNTTSPSSSFQQQGNSPRRKVLTEIDPNSSQKSVMALSSFLEASQEVKSPEAAATTASLDESFTTAVTRLDTSKSDQGQENITVLSISEGGGRQGTFPSPLSASPKALGSNLAQITSNRAASNPNICLYVASRCRLHKHDIMLSPELVPPSAELSTLLESHGLCQPILRVKEWLLDEATKDLVSSGFPYSRETVLFVETQEKKEETKQLLDYIERTRSCLPEEQRQWIRVYDWRMLKALSVVEDPCVEEKEADWFDARRRWDCGLV